MAAAPGRSDAGLQHLNSLEAENRRLKLQLAFAEARKQLNLQKCQPAEVCKIPRAECGMEHSYAQNRAADLGTGTAQAEMAEPRGVSRMGAGALTGRFAHLRSGPPRR